MHGGLSFRRHTAVRAPDGTFAIVNGPLRPYSCSFFAFNSESGHCGGLLFGIQTKTLIGLAGMDTGTVLHRDLAKPVSVRRVAG
jgi:hypothetical protein